MYEKLKLLDCTLRDGGYINDWNFSRECYEQMVYRLQRAGIDIIELGILGVHSETGFKTKFRSIEEIPQIHRLEGSTAIFTVMLNAAEKENFLLKERKARMVDGIRLAYFKADYKEAIAYARELKEKGYLVFMQAMATFMYSEDELSEMLEEINQLTPYAFYMVDSFGTMYPQEISAMYHSIDKILNKEIMLGFHAHNNLQMANANAIEFLRCGKERNLAVDGSIYGMGRGAGNANLELLIEYLEREGMAYNNNFIWSLYSDYIEEFRNHYSWGYLPEQYLASKYRTNPAYIWYLSKLGVHDFSQIEGILKSLPAEKRYTLHKELVGKLLLTANVQKE